MANAVGWSLGWCVAHSLIAPIIRKAPGPDGGPATGFGILLYAELVLVTIIYGAITGLFVLRTVRE
jgi:hypothetical protein